jgi:hypothetical protein
MHNRFIVRRNTKHEKQMQVLRLATLAQDDSFWEWDEKEDLSANSVRVKTSTYPSRGLISKKLVDG